MATINDVLKVAKPVERVVHVCVAGHVAAEYEDAVFKLSMAQDEQQAGGRLGSAKPDTKELESEVERLGAIMREHTFEFRIQALSALKWSNLLNEHPDPEKALIFNQTTFPAAAIAACTVEPSGFDDPEQVEKLFDVLSPAQQNDLFEAVWEIHQIAPKGLIS